MQETAKSIEREAKAHAFDSIVTALERAGEWSIELIVEITEIIEKTTEEDYIALAEILNRRS